MDEIMKETMEALERWKTEDKDGSLEKINFLLAEIKNEMKTNWGPEINAEKELILFIKDKKVSPWRKQTEDIEGDVDEMRMLSR